MVLLQGIKMEAFEKVSVMVSMVLYELETGSLTMKSMAIYVKGVEYISEGMGNGCGFGLFSWFFLDWQVVHPCMYSVTSFFRFGHQKSLFIAQVVLEIPGWLAVRESWYCKITPLFRLELSITMRRSPYQNRLSSFFRGNVVAHLAKRSGCCDWCACTRSLMVESEVARENRQLSMVVCTKRCGSSTVTSVLSFDPLS